jgi:hypothetical protein
VARTGRAGWIALQLVAAAAMVAGCGDDDDAGDANGSRADAASARGGRVGRNARDAGDGGGRGPAAFDAGGDAGGTQPGPAKPDAAVDALDDDDAGCSAPALCPSKGPDGPCIGRALGAPLPLASEAANVLLVHDRSGSMAEAWSATSRWQAAGAAVKQAFAGLLPSSRAGAVFFPSPDPDAPLVCIDPTGVACMFAPLYQQGGTCGVGGSGDADQLDFASGADFLAAFAQEPQPGLPRYAPVPGSLTPLKEALQEAQTRLANAQLEGKVAVIVISDGEPNCAWDATVAQQIVADWHAAGIDLHALALPSTTAPASALGELARAGGTLVREPADASGLASELEQIVHELQGGLSPSCLLAVPSPPSASEALQLVVTFAAAPSGTRYRVPQDLGSGSGWQANGDRSEVELFGKLCEAARAGRFATFSFEAGCVDLPDLPAL